MPTLNYDAAPNGSGMAFKRWIEQGLLPGDFLTAVLENNLAKAAAAADHVNQRLLWDYAYWLHNNAPAACWGSKEQLDHWRAHWADYQPALRAVHHAEVAQGGQHG